MKDIPERSKEEIHYLINLKVINGYPDGTFKPSLEVSREEAVTMVARAIQLNGEPRKVIFNDVKDNSWSSGYIQSAYEKGLLDVNNGKFRPKDKMTRGEMAVLLQRAFDLKGEGTVIISDVSTNHRLHDAINAVMTAGLSNGYPDGTFKPDNKMLREEFALFVARGLNENYRVYPDNIISDETDGEENEEPQVKEAIVRADILNLRSTPTDASPDNIIGKLPEGTRVTIHHYEGNWVYVTAGDLTGYVFGSYLQLVTHTNKIIAIDPGHGGHDPGAIGNGLVEKEVNLDVALRVKKILEKEGINVFMTRVDDTYLTLEERVKVSVENHADTFVSIHSNTYTDSSANGTETYFSTASLNPRAEQSKQLATFIQERLYKALGTKNRGVKEGKFVVIHRNPLPSALIELGFLSNKGDAEKLGSEYYRQIAAEAIAYGIIDYYNWRQ